MGHLLALATVTFFLALLVAKLWLSYVYAVRHSGSLGPSRIEMPEGGLRFCVKRGFAVFFVLAGIGTPVVLVVCMAHTYRAGEPVMGAFWLLFDLSWPATAIMLAAAVQGFRQYLQIYRDGFVYREIFRARRYAQEDLRGVWCTSEMIFVRVRGQRLPVMISGPFDGDMREIAALLRGLVG